jgi:hypothetical protein
MFYFIKSEQISLAKRVARSVLVFAITLISAFIFHQLWSANGPWSLGQPLFDSLVAGAAFFLFESQRREYEIEITDDSISMRGGLWFWTAARKVRRGHIRFLRETHGNLLREPALRLSEHGLVRRFLFGYVWIPTSMKEYEQIKHKALSWMEIG